jgi:hypothetical protein
MVLFLVLSSGCVAISEKYDSSDSTEPWSSRVDDEESDMMSTVSGGADER